MPTGDRRPRLHNCNSTSRPKIESWRSLQSGTRHTRSHSSTRARRAFRTRFASSSRTCLRNGGDANAVSDWVATAEPSQEIAFIPGRVLLQDFTGVPASSTSPRCATRCATRAATRRRSTRSSRRARHRPLGPGRRVRVAARDRAQRRARVRSATRSATQFLRWGQGAFDNFKVVPPDTGIVPPGQPRVPRARRRRARRQGRLPRHARRHRLAHDDDQRPRRARLGRRRHRGRGGDARRSRSRCSSRRSSASSSRASCPRARPRPTSCSPSREMLRKKGVVGKFVEFFGAGPRRARRSPTARRIANMAPEYGATCGIFPSTPRRSATCASPAATSAGRARRGVLQGARPLLARRARATRSTRDIARARPRDRRAVPRGPEPPAGPRPARATRRRSFDRRRSRARSAPSRANGKTPSTTATSHARLGRHRRDHELHEHVEPVGADRRGPPREEGGRAAGSRASRG